MPALTTDGGSVYAGVVPRIVRDVSAIKVTIHPGTIGTGTEKEGGGPLRGGLHLMNRFSSVIEDPEIPYEIVVTVGAHNGWLAVESIAVSKQPGGPVVTGMSLRSVAPGLYLQRIRQELEGVAGGALITKPADRGEGWVSYDLPLAPGDVEGIRLAELRRAARAARVTPEIAAQAYREALADPDPGVNRRPIAAAADRLGVARGYVSTLISQARKQGIEGLGPGRPARRRDAR